LGKADLSEEAAGFLEKFLGLFFLPLRCQTAGQRGQSEGDTVTVFHPLVDLQSLGQVFPGFIRFVSRQV